MTVDDALAALQALACEHRRRLGIPLLAIVGSNGKTTTKELVSRVPVSYTHLMGTGKSFLRHTFERFAPLVPDENFIVVTNRRYKELIRNILPEIRCV